MSSSNLRPGLASLFIDRYGRLRSGIRFGVFTSLFVFSLVMFSVAAMPLLAAAGPAGKAGTPLFWLVNSIAALASALLAGWLSAGYLEKLPFRSLGAWFTGRWARNFFAGLLLGAASLSLAVGIAAIAGGLSFELERSAGVEAILRTLTASALIFLVAAAAEEALFRGYVLQTFSRSGLVVFGVLATSVMFATVHNTNPNASLLSWTNTFLAGIWFGVAYLKTRDLWLVTGLHAAWNWMQGAFFGVEVSGLTGFITAPLFREIDSGPAWLTGSDYGLEGGIAATFALLLSIAALWFLPFLKPDKELLALTLPPPTLRTPPVEI
ncbi:MAG TPA: CPBP family intramembrane metalloprotease [Pyrinomonadaceae bacterium]|nr:CPBP family intramembrane metalloprotease [Pyrinomonadaceae bacterium]HMP65600.1 CPBP family intramembrane metalloprotease [Pyrinomonadaceae bacterium]